MNRNNRKGLYAIGFLAVYVILLVLLRAAEASAPDATIHTWPEALWYSLTTMTTVGYGDLYPVTTGGRIIGAVFQLLSLGILALIISSCVLLVRDRIYPLWLLRNNPGKPLYIFVDKSEEAETLAQKLDGPVFFCGEGNTVVGTATTMSPEELIRHKGTDVEASVFCMSEHDFQNSRTAASLSGLDCRVYCLSQYEPDQLPDNLTLFNPYEICARLYWHRFPLLEKDEHIVFVGEGRYMDELLEQGLMLNVVDPQQAVVYTVIGDSEDFQRNHPYLQAFCSGSTAAGTGDTVVFWNDPWNEHREALEQASRIIVCNDSEEETFRILSEMKRYVPLRAPVHARLSAQCTDVTVFGTDDELWTPELVMHTQLSRLAVRLNEIYRAQTGYTYPDWKGLSSFTRRSNLASADHLEHKIRILLGKDVPVSTESCAEAYKAFRQTDGEERERLRMIEHERWNRFHLLNGWQYSPVRDNSKRLHPMIVPYEQLSERERAKDDYAWEILGTLAEHPAEKDTIH